VVGCVVGLGSAVWDGLTLTGVGWWGQVDFLNSQLAAREGQLQELLGKEMTSSREAIRVLQVHHFFQTTGSASPYCC
jgi:hypothetical protein